MSRKAVVLYSGGLDSTTCLAIARAEGFEPYAMSFAYGQRHAAELAVAKANASAMGAAEHLVVEFDLRKARGATPLLTSGHRKPHKKDLPRLVSDEVFQYVLRNYVRK